MEVDVAKRQLVVARRRSIIASVAILIALAYLVLDFRKPLGIGIFVLPSILIVLYLFLLRPRKWLVFSAIVCGLPIGTYLIYKYLAAIRPYAPNPFGDWEMMAGGLWGVSVLLTLVCFIWGSKVRRCWGLGGAIIGILSALLFILAVPPMFIEDFHIYTLYGLLTYFAMFGALWGALRGEWYDLVDDPTKALKMLKAQKLLTAILLLAVIVLSPIIWACSHTLGYLLITGNGSGLLWKLRLAPRDDDSCVVDTYIYLDPEGALRFDNKRWRYRAAYIIGHEGDQRARPVLEQALREGWDEKDGTDTWDINKTLAKLGSPLVLPYFEAELRNKEHLSVYPFTYIPGKEADKFLQEVFAGNNKQNKLRAAYVLCLRGDKKAIEYCASLLKKSGNDQQYVTECLAKIHDLRAMQYLIKQLRSPNLKQKYDAAFIMAEIGDPRALPVLIEEYKDPGNYGSPGAAVGMIGYIPGEAATQALFNIMNGKYGRLDDTAARTLAKRGDVRAIPFLMDEMRRTSEYDRDKAQLRLAYSLHFIPSEKVHAIQIYRDVALNSRDANYQWMAATAYWTLKKELNWKISVPHP